MQSNRYINVKLLTIVSIVIVFWLVIPGTFYYFSHNLESAGQLGDLFGIVNALFSGLAFVMLIIELNFQRQELKLTRQAMTDQRDQLKAQSEELKKQNYESVFFKLLEIINYEIDSITGQDGYEKEEGFTLLRSLSSCIDNEIPAQTYYHNLKMELKKLLKRIIKQEFDIIAEKVWFLFKYIEKIGSAYKAETKIYEDILSNSLTFHVHRILILYFLTHMGKTFGEVQEYSHKMQMDMEEILGKHTLSES